MNSVEKELTRKLEEHEAIVMSLKVALGLFRGEAVVKKTKRHSTVIEQALAIEASRNGHAAPAPKKLGRPKGSKGPKKPQKKLTLMERRAYTKSVLAMFGEEPRSVPEVGLTPQDGLIVGSLTRYGYLKAKGKPNGRYPRFVVTGREYADKPEWLDKDKERQR